MRILIVDDHECARTGIRTALEHQSGIEICGEASNGHECLHKVLQLRPDAVILDLTMPVLDGFSTARGIKRLSPSIKIVLVSMHEGPNVMELAKSSGASAFVGKGQSLSVLMRALDAVAHDQTFFSTGDPYPN
jgi:DNA-binding NarL/FixJ family response regulator